MKNKIYTQELKQQFIKEVKETENVTIVGRRHEVAPATIYWKLKRTNKDTITKPNGIINIEVLLEKQYKS